ncbi:MAG: hypothetical protein E6K80_01740 [Candidatus Eisenbacteria bacterium]|uniref:DoxX family protein n=1 Tax=Eiseniibacteriota bacterium TaxID=2212470 RepID=A0A538UAB1_UNCEI|nr:MAG: hypothetical protein E6K80_01740 [Candidatus Eisenbacteria bacterium]
MTRPVRPVALVILTTAMIYPGVTMLFQGGYPFISGDYFNLVGDYGPWASFLGRFGVPQIAVDGFKALIGLMWIGGVLGLWAGDGKAYPLAFAAAVLTLLYPGGPMVMAIAALACLIFFRENAEEVPA